MPSLGTASAEDEVDEAEAETPSDDKYMEEIPLPPSPHEPATCDSNYGQMIYNKSLLSEVRCGAEIVAIHRNNCFHFCSRPAQTYKWLHRPPPSKSACEARTSTPCTLGSQPWEQPIASWRTIG